LGVNGAGKTTTFKILSGEIKQTSGSAHIKFYTFLFSVQFHHLLKIIKQLCQIFYLFRGYNVSTEMNKARNFIGYCP